MITVNILMDAKNMFLFVKNLIKFKNVCLKRSTYVLSVSLYFYIKMHKMEKHKIYSIKTDAKNSSSSSSVLSSELK